MGTITFHKPAGMSAIDAIKRECGEEWCAKHVIAATATREAVFLVGRFHDPDSTTYVPDADGYVRTLLVFKLSLSPRSHYNFGYKDMTETMYPYGCEAPLSIIAECSELHPRTGDNGGSLEGAHAYRDCCRAMAEQKALKRSLNTGDKLTLREPLTFAGEPLQSFIVRRQRVRGRKGLSTVFMADSGILCAISARNLAGATVQRQTA